tara:strand:+ start:162 stop:530 length:369 start_codon:yes stop_codon:yes gene_type:complete
MDQLTKHEFINKFKEDFTGDDNKGYLHNGSFISESELSEITNNEITNLGEVEQLLNTGTEDELIDFNNQLMAFIFSDEEEFQGSYEEKEGSGDFCWYLDFGNIEIKKDKKGINYTGVRFYKE